MKLSTVSRYDWLLVAVTAILVALGFSFVYSSSLSLESQRQLLITQGIAATVGGIALILAARLDYRIYRTWARSLYIVMIVLLIGVLFLGEDIRGAHAWFNLGVFRVQPSEFAKFFVIVGLSKYFSDHRDELSFFRHLLVSFIYTLIPVLLILLEPDLGSALILLGIWGGMVLMVGIKRWHLLIFISGFVIAALVAWNFLLRDYQKDRVTTFLAPLENCQTVAAYNVCQSYIAIGSGGVTGRGFGQGTQSQLNFLPEKHTDFIFAVIAEELGFVGVVFLLGVFGVLLFRIFRTSQKAQDNFGLFLALGIGMLILVQTIVNLGSNLGVLPVTGVTLPLVSYGGSSLLSTLFMIGVVLSVHVRQKKQRFS